MFSGSRTSKNYWNSLGITSVFAPGAQKSEFPLDFQFLHGNYQKWWKLHGNAWFSPKWGAPSPRGGKTLPTEGVAGGPGRRKYALFAKIVNISSFPWKIMILSQFSWKKQEFSEIYDYCAPSVKTSIIPKEFQWFGRVQNNKSRYSSWNLRKFTENHIFCDFSWFPAFWVKSARVPLPSPPRPPLWVMVFAMFPPSGRAERNSCGNVNFCKFPSFLYFPWKFRRFSENHGFCAPAAQTSIFP